MLPIYLEHRYSIREHLSSNHNLSHKHWPQACLRSWAVLTRRIANSRWLFKEEQYFQLSTFYTGRGSEGWNNSSFEGPGCSWSPSICLKALTHTKHRLYLSLCCSIYLVGVGVLTLESGDQCIPAYFAERRNGSAIAARLISLIKRSLKTTQSDKVLTILSSNNV